MSGILTPGERTDAWGTIGDLARRVGRLEAVDPCECPITPFPTYDDIVGTIDVPYAYYKLPETGTDDWVDSSGGSRNLTDTTRTGEVRGVAGVVAEDDGKLGVYAGTDTPGAVNPASYIGNRSDNFFKFWALAPFSVVAWVNPDFTTSGSPFSWGICGTVDNDAGGAAALAGWGLYVNPASLKPFVRMRNLSGVGTQLTVESGTPALTQGLWSMVASTFDGTTLSMWVDGAVAATGTGAPSLDAGDSLFLGNCGIAEGFGGTWAPWKGTLDSVIVAAGDLSSLIPALYAAGPTAGVATGWVWTNVDGVAQWAAPTIEVEF